MSASLLRKLGDLWLPALIAVGGVLTSLAAWGTLVANRRSLLLESTAENASQVREAVQLQLDEQLRALRGLSELWSDFGLQSLAEWTSDVDDRMQQVNGLASVAWVDLEEPTNRIAAGSPRSAQAIQRDLETARRHRDAPYLDGPEHGASREAGYGVFLPVRTPQDHAGVLVAHFEIPSLLDDVLQGRAQDYALALFWKGEPIFARGTPSPDRWQRWWRVEDAVPLPLGGHWQVVLRPTPELAAARLTPVPHYLLGVGVLLSLVLAAVVYQFRVIVRQSRFLTASNRALEERGLTLESRVAERTEAREDAVAELEAFNYSVAHDLRSPLGAILNFTSILQEDYQQKPLDAEGIAMLDRIRQSTARASNLLDDLLHLSRAGRAALTLELLDMTALARESFAQARASGDAEDVEFRVDPLPVALGDRTLLGDVFANLFSNALKYSRGREKRRISVTGRIEGDECVYAVTDNGIGFDMRFAGKLFGLFERLHAEGAFEGTGIGLAMVARIVKRHGGRVWAEGRPGEGATFGFALPMRAAP
jgi:signal transduction histidine kinase